MERLYQVHQSSRHLDKDKDIYPEQREDMGWESMGKNAGFYLFV